MSRFAHRQPAWGTISVVLLSALFLSPMTGAALLHALALDASWRLANPSLNVVSEEAAPAASQPKEPSSPQRTVSPAAAPRRTSEEDEAALRRAADALRGQVLSLRLHPDPEGIAAGSEDAFLVLLPERTILLVPDDGPRDGGRRPSEETLPPRAAAARPASPRAPPLA